jgi:cytochrome c556
MTIRFSTSRRLLFLSAGALTVLASSLAVRASQGPPAQGGARPLVPMTASTIVRDPAAQLGQNVSMMAAVEAILSKTVFTVDQDKTKSVDAVIVISPFLSGAPDLNSYVTVQGEVIRFDPAEISKRAPKYTLDLMPDQVEKYRGRPAVLATVVLTATLTDLAKRPIPPMTAEEQLFSQWMKTVNPAFTAIRGGLEAPDAAQLKQQTAALKQAFTQVESFYKLKGVADALKWAGEAVKFAAAMEQGAASGKWDEVKAAAGGLQPLCAQCHNQHRERMEDGTFRFRTGGGQ